MTVEVADFNWFSWHLYVSQNHLVNSTIRESNKSEDSIHEFSKLGQTPAQNVWCLWLWL